VITREYTIPGLHVREHRLDVPLDWDRPDGPTLSVFARELVAPEKRHEELPCLLYLQGGPGGKSPRPTAAEGWIGQALERHRVVLLDQRGTGRSSRIDSRRISAFPDAAAAAEFLSFFRADSIVRDAEALRRADFGSKRWITLGQSYGGFLTLTYLSSAPQGLAACLVTGGLASVTPDASEVYRRTYPRVQEKNRIFYRRYPHDVELVGRIADRLQTDPVHLPDGDVLTVRRLQSLGIDLGMKPGMERLHWLLDEAFAADDDELSDVFLSEVLHRSSYADNPLFAVMQESIYGSGPGATGWAAERERANHPQFAEKARPLLFTGEMMYPWMFEEIRGLRAFGPAVELLASRNSWSPLYDLDRLATNEVPVVAAVYFDDMYVDSGLQLETARRVGNLQPWVTNEYEHDGIGSDRVFRQLMQMLADNGGSLIHD
jgi:pimeloyl-ACP methyl ester carboxylesterase